MIPRAARHRQILNVLGHEIEYPPAVVILGGLFTSTVLNLFLLPPLYARFGRPVSGSPGAAPVPPNG